MSMWLVTIAKRWWIDSLLIALVIGCAIAYLHFVESPPGSSSEPRAVVEAKEAKVVTKYVTKRVMVPGPERIVYLDKQEAAEALKMPSLATSPDNVLAAVTIPASGDRPVTAVATLTTQGEGKVEYRMEAQPFWKIKKEFGMRAGMGTGGLLTAEVYLHPLRVGPVEVELRGWIKRDDLNGGDGGGAVLLDWRF